MRSSAVFCFISSKRCGVNGDSVKELISSDSASVPVEVGALETASATGICVPGSYSSEKSDVWALRSVDCSRIGAFESGLLLIATSGLIVICHYVYWATIRVVVKFL